MATKRPTLLLNHYLKQLRLPTMLREYQTTAQTCAKENKDHIAYLLQLVERETFEREQRAAERRIKSAKFPVIKTLDTFDFKVQPGINKTLVRDLMRGEYLEQHENILFLGNPGTGRPISPPHSDTLLVLKANVLNS